LSTSDTEIASLALTRIGQARILDIAGESENAVLCNMLYPKARDEVLRSHKWRCAIERQSLARLSAAPAGAEYDYQFQLPTDPYCLRVLGMPDNPTAAYEIEGDRLLTNETACLIKYLKRITTPSKLDSLLSDAIVLKLALKLSFKIVPDLKVRKDIEDEYKDVIIEARRVNMIEVEVSEQDNTDWVDAGR